MTKYCFFGSSVTEQSTNHATGEMVGYVDHLINNYLGKKENTFLRVAKGNTCITDAGLVLLNEVINWNPDYCILDWCTASITTADKNSVFHIYTKLLINGIVPITVVFPRKDRNASSTEVYKHSYNACCELNTPFIDIKAVKPLDSILRDAVHTTAKGGEYYASKIQEVLIDKNFVTDINTVKNNSADEYIYTTELPVKRKFHLYKKNDLSKITGYTIKFSKHFFDNNSDGTIQIFMELQIGPYAPLLSFETTTKDDNTVHAETLSLIDPWCYRERTAFKAVSPSLNIPLTKIISTVSSKAPDVSCLLKAIDTNINQEPRYLKQIKRTYLIYRSKTDVRDFNSKKITLTFQ